MSAATRSNPTLEAQGRQADAMRSDKRFEKLEEGPVRTIVTALISTLEKLTKEQMTGPAGEHLTRFKAPVAILEQRLGDMNNDMARDFKSAKDIFYNLLRDYMFPTFWEEVQEEQRSAERKRDEDLKQVLGDLLS